MTLECILGVFGDLFDLRFSLMSHDAAFTGSKLCPTEADPIILRSVFLFVHVWFLHYF